MSPRRSSLDRSADGTTRRRFLGAVGGATGTAALAGCLSEPTASSGYTDWLAAPDLFGGRRYSFDYYDVASIRDQREAFDPSAYETYRSWAVDGYDDFGLPFDAIEEELLAVNQRQTIVRGEWDMAALAARLKDSGYVESDSRSGFEVFRHRQAKLAVAVDEEHLLRSRLTDLSPLGTVRLFVDVGRGEKRRYTDADSVIGELTERLGEGTYVFGFPHFRIRETSVEYGEFQGAEARGLARTVDGAETTDKVVVTFREESAVADAMADIERWIDTVAPFEGAETVSTDTEGRSAVVTLRRRTAALDELTPRI